MRETMVLLLSTSFCLLFRKRSLCFLSLLFLALGSFSTLGLVRPYRSYRSVRFPEGSLTHIQRSCTTLVLLSLNPNNDEESNEETHAKDISSESYDTSDDDDDDDDDNNEDDEDTVQAPPAVLRGDQIFLPRRLPLEILCSVKEKEHRRQERSLLKQLQEGDDAVRELRMFWRSQSGSSRKNEELLHQAATGIGDPSCWQESQEMLEGLCAENPTFLQPFALLSKLYCLMGRLEDSQTVALEVLKLKPWHFLAIETMVATSYALNQINTSVYWASRRLPPPSQVEKRREWIDRALTDSLDFENDLVIEERDLWEETGKNNNGDNSDSFQDEETDIWQ
mmetsp:Transcript_11874/g.34053  ORF Transcript_11874/g.34053 Transcript_11874/m.34053 type:complete len:337 (+) Transcript_11874:85-1095(+)